MREYYQKNKKHMDAQMRVWKRKPENVARAAYLRSFIKEELAVYQREYYQKNKQKLLAQAKLYRKRKKA